MTHTEEEQRAQMPGAVERSELEGLTSPPAYGDVTKAVVDRSLIEGAFHALCSYAYGNGSAALAQAYAEQIAMAIPGLQTMAPRFADEQSAPGHRRYHLARSVFIAAGGRSDDPCQAQKIQRIQFAIRDAVESD